jgi:hypothetical protein
MPLPDIYEVYMQPDPVLAGASVHFWANLVDYRAYPDWSWDFGGGCNPSTSVEMEPTVQAEAAGSYACSVTATNPKGTDTYAFTLTVN